MRRQEFDRTLKRMDLKLREFDQIFQTIARLQKKYYTEKGVEIDKLIANFSKEELEALIEEVDVSWICPITQEIIREPVRPSDGRSYERSALQQWYDSGQRPFCPHDRNAQLAMPTKIPVDEKLQDEIILLLRERLHQKTSLGNNRKINEEKGHESDRLLETPTASADHRTPRQGSMTKKNRRNSVYGLFATTSLLVGSAAGYKGDQRHRLAPVLAKNALENSISELILQLNTSSTCVSSCVANVAENASILSIARKISSESATDIYKYFLSPIASCVTDTTRDNLIASGAIKTVADSAAIEAGKSYLASASDSIFSSIVNGTRDTAFALGATVSSAELAAIAAKNSYSSGASPLTAATSGATRSTLLGEISWFSNGNAWLLLACSGATIGLLAAFLLLYYRDREEDLSSSLSRHSP